MIELAGITLGPMDLLVAVALATAVVTDLARMRIYDWITYPLWGIGILYHLVWGFSTGAPWWTGLVGFLVLFPIHFTLFAVGLDKGGDAKLMIGVGACLGWWVGVEATLWSILLMLPVALVVATATGKLGSVWRSLTYVLRSILMVAIKLQPGKAPPQTYIPKGPVIAVAVVVARFTTFADAWLLNDTLRSLVP